MCRRRSAFLQCSQHVPSVVVTASGQKPFLRRSARTPPATGDDPATGGGSATSSHRRGDQPQAVDQPQARVRDQAAAVYHVCYFLGNQTGDNTSGFLLGLLHVIHPYERECKCEDAAEDVEEGWEEGRGGDGGYKEE